MPNASSQNALYIVATPIGNLADISLRAIEILKQVDWVVAEDTRHSRTLFQQYDITTRMSALHAHNEHEAQSWILQKLREGQNIALISDAGTPLISDPGYLLVAAAKAENIAVIPVPGACAAIAALSASGLPTDKFCFEGFLSAKTQARQTRLRALRYETRTLIFYEAPHRLLACLQDLVEIFGETREAVLARELTKRYENIHKKPLGELLSWVVVDTQQQQGEIVLVVAGYESMEADTELLTEEEQRLLDILAQELPPQQTARLMAKWGQRTRQAYYKYLLNVNKKLLEKF